MRDRVWVRDFETAFLQIVAVIEKRSADEERAFWIDNHAHVGAFDHDVAIGRSIHQVHLVLQPRTSAADYRYAQRAARPALFLKQR